MNCLLGAGIFLEGKANTAQAYKYVSFLSK